VETEAYYGNHTVEDEACHAHGTKTERTRVFYGKGGRAYVYICYGIHRMLNVITGEQDRAGGVLLRAVEPVDGVNAMKTRRSLDETTALTNGPGKLCEAFNITKELYGHTVTQPPLYIAAGDTVSTEEVAQDTRIGINKAEELELRFYEKQNAFVSQ
jgi:DNA-3-methyladenine glycosylase